MKRFLSLIMVAALVLTVFGAAALADEKITLTIFNIYTPEDPSYAGYIAAIDRFKAANPNVDVQFEGITQIEYQAKLNAMIAAGNMPDLFDTRDDWNFDLVRQGKIRALDDMIAADLEWSGRFLNIWAEQTVEGKVYGIPRQFITNEAVYYNTRIAKELGYDKFPETWEDFETFLQACKDAGYIPLVLGARDGWPVWSHLGEPLTQFMCGNEWVAEVGKFNKDYTYENPEFISVLQRIKGLMDKGFLNSDAVAADSAEAAQYYYAEQAVCMLSGSWTASGLQNEAPPEVFEATDAAPLPRPVDAKAEVGYGTFTGGSGWAWAIKADIDPAKLPYAEALIKEIVGPETALGELALGRMPALALDKIEGVDTIEISHLLKSFLTHISNAPGIYQMNRQQNGNTMCDTIYKKCQEMLTGMITPEEAAAAIQKTYLEVAATR